MHELIIKKEGNQDRFVKDALSQTSKLVSLAAFSGKDEASILHQLQDYPDYVIIWERSQQLANEAMWPDSFISGCQVDKHGTGLLLSIKRILNALRKQKAWSTIDLPCQNLAWFSVSCG